MFWENFNRLCNSKGVTPNGVAKELGIPSGSVTDWKKGRTPRSATQIKIADYFGVSVNALNWLSPIERCSSTWMRTMIQLRDSVR